MAYPLEFGDSPDSAIYNLFNPVCTCLPGQPAHEPGCQLWVAADNTLATIHREHQPEGPYRTVSLCADHLRTAESCLMVDARWSTTDEACFFCGDRS